MYMYIMHIPVIGDTDGVCEGWCDCGELDGWPVKGDDDGVNVEGDDDGDVVKGEGVVGEACGGMEDEDAEEGREG